MIPLWLKRLVVLGLVDLALWAVIIGSCYGLWWLVQQ